MAGGGGAPLGERGSKTEEFICFLLSRDVDPVFAKNQIRGLVPQMKRDF